MDKEIAVVWHLDGEWGGGEWMPDTDENRKQLAADVDALNSLYTVTNHWMILRVKAKK